MCSNYEVRHAATNAVTYAAAYAAAYEVVYACGFFFFLFLAKDGDTREVKKGPEFIFFYQRFF